METKLNNYFDRLLSDGLDKNYWFMTKQTLSNFYLPLFITGIVDSYHSEHYSSENFARYYKRCFEENEYAHAKFPAQSDGENRYRNAIIAEYLGLFTKPHHGLYDDGVVTPAYKILRKYINKPEDMSTYQYLIDRQIEKLFLNNSLSNNYDELKEIKIFPVIFVYKVLLELEKKYNSSRLNYDEFLLFVVHAKKYSDYENVIDLIDEYRKNNNMSKDLKEKINIVLSHETMKNIRFDSLIGILKHIKYDTKTSYEIANFVGSKSYIETVVDMYEHSDFNTVVNESDCVKFMQSDSYFIGKLESIPMVQVSSLEKEFKNWLNVARREDNNQLYTEESKIKYKNNLSKISEYICMDIYEISTIASFDKILDNLTNDKVFKEKDEVCKHSYSCALKIYERFLKEYIYKKGNIDKKDYMDIYDHTLYGIHIKKQNSALSDTNPHICIGWSYLGNTLNIPTLNELKDYYKQIDPDANNFTIGQNAGQIWRFNKEANNGDYVIYSDSKFIHIGKIISETYFDSNVEDQDNDYVYNRKVIWLKTYIERNMLSEVFLKSIDTAMSFFTLNDYKSAAIDLLNDCYVKDEFVNGDDNMNLVIDESTRVKDGENTILYGVPGCGKSWIIKNEYCNDDSKIERLVFHPDFTYSDFIGQIMPKLNDKDIIEYPFVPGPFTKILKQAYTDPYNKYYLIIEEVNRGNAPAIFGDIFQLLDRDENGNSEFKITNEDIAKIVYGDSKHKVSIPSNMSIICTMNTSDQNVFTLDTAFQRRWNMRLVKNEFNLDEPSELIFADTLILDSKISWDNFINEINKIVLEKNIKMTSSEDKRLGTHFVKPIDLIYDDELDAYGKPTIRAKMQNRRFAEKVLKYLWDDAFKFTKEDVFDLDNYNSLEKVIDKFITSNGNERFKIFKENIFNALILTCKA